MSESESTEADAGPIDCGKGSRPCMGERVSGDIALCETRDNLFFAAMVDVLGHGPEAHEESLEFASAISESWSPDLAAMFAKIDSARRGGRGAAVSLACLDLDSGVLHTATIGNTTTRIIGRDSSVHAVATDGIVGQQYRTPMLQQFPMKRDSLVLMYSDGVQGSFGLEDYPQMRYQSAGAVARTIVRKFSRSYDDATCLAFRFAQ